MKQQVLALSTAICRGRPLVTNYVLSQHRFTSSSSAKTDSGDKSANAAGSAKKKEGFDKLKKTHKSMADADEEMRRAMENLAGDGGESGVELEDGKPVAMKRGVRENMFRYI
ncbi:uncharacterized protein Z520_01873 [Fonsecaea multimorphosa CBS 102226]|uniref:Uncharacterized protein n=1 Tax=Fonsecaea multimorphosa CBS 102226 TaxID=1442371 RepID=A0A0D2KEG1_9EURO|nr:uncharacterized protein Z520_01873 [Fonsecaea multimorphosa CBS 102226]KIY01735.1 hypothetical protein Z520_01873 [Fonsecaea multimorphosa CBS 102226]